MNCLFQRRQLEWVVLHEARWSCHVTWLLHWRMTKLDWCSGSRMIPPNQFTLMIQEVQLNLKAHKLSVQSVRPPLALEAIPFIVVLSILDCRSIAGKSYLSARHWSDDAVLEGRAFFRGDNNPGRLVLDNINPYDQGLYKCRVDFATAPTRISSVMLDVIVPPEKPRIHDESNQEVRLKLGPYKIGETVTITCEVSTIV